MIGWDEIDVSGSRDELIGELERKTERGENIERLAMDAAAAFSTAAGQRTLEYLRTLARAPVADPEKPAACAYYREGQNDIVRRLERLVQLGLDISNG